MSYLQFPKFAHVKVIGASGENIGSFTLVQSTSLQHILLSTFIKGPRVGKEKMRINLYSSASRASITTSSDWVKFSEIEDMSEKGFLGWVRFDFNGIVLNNQYPYYIDIETANYTRGGDYNFVSFLLEDYRRITSVSSGTLAATMAVIGKR